MAQEPYKQWCISYKIHTSRYMYPCIILLYATPRSAFELESVWAVMFSSREIGINAFQSTSHYRNVSIMSMPA